MNDYRHLFEVFIQDPDEDRWRPLANCKGKDTEMFFVGKAGHNSRVVKRAIAICDECVVKKECLDYALQWDERRLPGIWGGMTGRERLRERQKRGIITRKVIEGVRQTA